MSAIRARVQNGRLHVDQPTALPGGTVLDLVVDDEGDDLTDADTVLVLAVWGAVRGAGPDLRRLLQ